MTQPRERRDDDSVVSTLELRIDVDDRIPIITILIDGRDRLGSLKGRFKGFDPEEILDSGALVPRDPPRRVAVYRCGECGEAGCACVAPITERRGDKVVWSDFRDITGVFVHPLTNELPSGGITLGDWTITFDADQYLAELDRAASDRSWETAARRSARLLRKQLGPGPE